MIQEQVATVYRSSRKGRRYFSLRSASFAEAEEIIKERYPTIEFDRETGEGYYWKAEIKRHDVLHRRLARIVRNNFNQLR